MANSTSSGEAVIDRFCEISPVEDRKTQAEVASENGSECAADMGGAYRSRINPFRREETGVEAGESDPVTVISPNRSKIPSSVDKSRSRIGILG